MRQLLKALNVEWIEKYFTVEEHDLMELGKPGRIYFIKRRTNFICKIRR